MTDCVIETDSGTVAGLRLDLIRSTSQALTDAAGHQVDTDPHRGFTLAAVYADALAAALKIVDQESPDLAEEIAREVDMRLTNGLDDDVNNDMWVIVDKESGAGGKHRDRTDG